MINWLKKTNSEFEYSRELSFIKLIILNYFNFDIFEYCRSLSLYCDYTPLLRIVP